GTARQENGLPVDAAVTARGASAEMIELVDRVGPFGAGHPEPVFAFPAHRVAYVEEIGNGNGHIRLSLATEDGATLKAMAFRCAGTPLGQALLAARGRPLHFAGTLSIDHWQSR